MAVCALLWLALPGAPPALAVEVSNLYSVEVPLDPGDRNARDSAYRQALTEVLVRITGTTAAAQSETLAALFPDPARFVTQYRPGGDDTLVVSLDGAAIERILRQAGASVWGSERPLTIVWLAVDWGQGDREIIGADNPNRPDAARTVDRNRLLRDEVRAAAARRGLPVVFPLMDTEDLQNIGFSDIWGGFDDQLLLASARYEAPSILVGRVRADTAQPARWTWYLGEERYAWPGQPEEAINQLADAMAGRFALRGGERSETIELVISGIDSVRAYGRVQRFMENLRIIDSLRIRSVAADGVSYDVELAGGVERLENALRLSPLLERVNGGIDGSRYDYNDRRAGGRPDPFSSFAADRLEYRYRGEPGTGDDDAAPANGFDES